MSARIEEAARWYADQGHVDRIVPTLRERFDLTAKEACEAIRRANELREARSL